MRHEDHLGVRHGGEVLRRVLAGHLHHDGRRVMRGVQGPVQFGCAGKASTHSHLAPSASSGTRRWNLTCVRAGVRRGRRAPSAGTKAALPRPASMSTSTPNREAKCAYSVGSMPACSTVQAGHMKRLRGAAGEARVGGDGVGRSAHAVKRGRCCKQLRGQPGLTQRCTAGCCGSCRAGTRGRCCCW